jgi:LPXTG-motif cell wall-anchored protein
VAIDALPIGDMTAKLPIAPVEHRENTVVRQLGFALLLTTLAGVASAKEKCKEYVWSNQDSDWCHHHHMKAPELDPASAMAGLTLMAGGLAVLSGRRRKNSEV